MAKLVNNTDLGITMNIHNTYVTIPAKTAVTFEPKLSREQEIEAVKELFVEQKVWYSELPGAKSFEEPTSGITEKTLAELYEVKKEEETEEETEEPVGDSPQQDEGAEKGE